MEKQQTAATPAKTRNRSVEGLRGIAILLIIASHTGVLLQGGLGNAIFFAASGFFAASPFRLNGGEDRFLTPRGIGDYYLSKLLRILPVYWITVTAIQLVTHEWFKTTRDLVRCLLFIDSYRHLWFLQNIMVFYLVTPLVMILLHFIRKMAGAPAATKNHSAAAASKAAAPNAGTLAASATRGSLLCCLFLLLLAAFSRYFLTVDRIWLLKQGKPQEIHFYQYFIGMAAGYLYKVIAGAKKQDLFRNPLCRIYPVLFLFFCVLSSKHILVYFKPDTNFLVGWRLPVLCTVLSCLCILCLLFNEGTLTARIYEFFPFGFVGKISFSIYIIHVVFMTYYHLGSGPLNFAAVFLSALGTSLLAYYLIEKPSALFSKNRRAGEIIQYYKNLFRNLEDD